MQQVDPPITSYAQFYRYYLNEHRNPICRLLHIVGTSLVFVLLAYALIRPAYWMLLLVPVCGYVFAWVGHLVFEKNRPATFRYPLWSLISDFRMFFEFISGRLSIKKDTEPTPRDYIPTDQSIR
jgi:hypothetical protein